MPERPIWTPAAWDDRVYWQGQDRKTLKRINALTQDTMPSPLLASDNPSRRAKISPASGRDASTTRTLVHALEDGDLAIVTCRYRYG